jgi:hypothetical protein
VFDEASQGNRRFNQTCLPFFISASLVVQAAFNDGFSFTTPLTIFKALADNAGQAGTTRE